MKDKLLKYDLKMRYQLLARMKEDCKYYLGLGNRNVNHIWSKDEKEQIQNMKILFNSFTAEEKPVWISMQEIEEYEKQMLQTSAKERMDITKEDVRCIDMDVEGMELSFGYELWFDVDQYFGTSIGDSGNTWINFYTSYGENGSISAVYFVESDTSISEYAWELTEKEKEFFKNKMSDFLGKDVSLVYYEYIGKYEEQAKKCMEKHGLTRGKCEAFLKEWDNEEEDCTKYTLAELLWRYIAVASGGTETYEDGKIISTPYVS